MIRFAEPPIAFHRMFVKIVGSVNAALMLSHALALMGRSDEGEWFCRTHDEWQDETGLTRREQDHARQLLRSAGLLSEKKLGLPAKLYFRIDIEKLQECLETLRPAPGATK